MAKSGPARDYQSVDLIWKAWYGSELLHLHLPTDWNVQLCPMADAPTINDVAIVAALRSPVAGPTLTTVAREKVAAHGCDLRVCIAVDDLARPTEAWRIVPALLDDLNAAGVADEQVYIIISLGTHRPLTREDMLKKLGEAVIRRVRVYNHSAYQNLVNLGQTSQGTPVEVNRDYATAHLKIAVGMLSPHGFAGYSGGGKIVVPGMSGFETVLSNHRPVVKGLTGRTGQIKGNTRRADLEEAARMVGLDWLVNTVSNSQAGTSAVFAGEPQAVYLTAAEVAIFNAFPKDLELIQALNSLNVWTSQEPERLIVKPGGTVIFIVAAVEGMGTHGLFGPGGALFVRRDKHGLFADILRGRSVAFLSPHLYRSHLIGVYPDSVLLFQEWDALLTWLREKHGPSARVAIFPTGPLQLAAEDIEALSE